MLAQRNRSRRQLERNTSDRTRGGDMGAGGNGGAGGTAATNGGGGLNDDPVVGGGGGGHGRRRVNIPNGQRFQPEGVGSPTSSVQILQTH